MAFKNKSYLIFERSYPQYCPLSIVAKIRKRLAVSNQAMQKFDKKFNLKELEDVDVKRTVLG